MDAADPAAQFLDRFVGLLAPAAGVAPTETTIEDDLRTCATLNYAPARLDCYNQVVLGIGVKGPVTLSDTRRALERILTHVEALEKACGPDESAAVCDAVEGVAMEKLQEMIDEIDAEERLRRLNEPEKVK